MTGMIRYATDSFDEFCHTRQCPEFGAESVSAGTPTQCLIQQAALCRCQLGFASRSTGGTQPLGSLLLPLCKPAVSTLPTSLKLTGDKRLRLASSKEPRRGQATAFESSKITTRA